MWTEVVNLLKLESEEGGELDQFFADLLDLNDWIRRQYGPKGLTCEEVALAYNHLVMEDLRKFDGRQMEAYPKLNARHIGEVLAAYRRMVDGDSDVRRVITQGLYQLPEPGMSPAEIDAFMEQALKEAMAEVRRTGTFYDTGNGLFSWLFNKGRVKPTAAEGVEARAEAEKRVRLKLAEQKRVAATLQFSTSTDGKDYTALNLRAVIAKRLSNVLTETGDFNSLVRQEAARIWLVNYLRAKTGTTTAPSAPPPPTPAGPRPFSHRQYIESLIEDLPTMGDEQVSDLQRQARQRNVLDVYELTTAEWNKRFPPKH